MPIKNKLWWHFNHDHTVDDLQITPIQQVSETITLTAAELELQKLEALWIKRLATMQPRGMNFVLQDSESRT